MCPEGMVAQNAALYYKISIDALNRGYHDKINKLRRSMDSATIAQSDYLQQLQTLEKLYNNQQKQLEELADRFARENFDDCSEIHTLAFEAFKAGNIEEAIRILESVDSKTEISNAQQHKARGKALEKTGNEMLDEAINAIERVEQLKTLAVSYATIQQIKETEELYRKNLIGDSTDIGSMTGLACCYEAQSNLQEAIKWYKKALEHSSRQPQLYQELLPELHCRIAGLFDQLNEPGLAEEHRVHCPEIIRLRQLNHKK
jgi:tetratricopeptide (TPR) repeat protein